MAREAEGEQLRIVIPEELQLQIEELEPEERRLERGRRFEKRLGMVLFGGGLAAAAALGLTHEEVIRINNTVFEAQLEVDEVLVALSGLISGSLSLLKSKALGEAKKGISGQLNNLRTELAASEAYPRPSVV